MTTVIHPPTLSRDHLIGQCDKWRTGIGQYLETGVGLRAQVTVNLLTFMLIIILVIMIAHLVTPEHGGHSAIRVPDHPVLGETPESHLSRPRAGVSVL